MEQTKAKTAEDKAFDLAISEYCKESESDGFLFGPDEKGCSLEKSNGYVSGFLNGFKKGYFQCESHIANLEAQIKTRDSNNEALSKLYFEARKREDSLEAQKNILGEALDRVYNMAFNSPMSADAACGEIMKIAEKALKEDKQDE